MFQKIRAELQIFAILLLVTAILAFLSMTIKTDSQESGFVVQPASQSDSALLDFTPAYTHYLPSLQKAPSYVYFDDFSDDDSGWLTYSTNDCDGEYSNDEYRLYVEDDSDSGDQDECFGPGPEETEYRYGSFEVRARRSDGSTHFRYGIYINGSGGDEYYLFWVEHDGSNCSWALIRREDGDNDTERSGDCDSRTNGYANSNTLKIRHTSDKVLRVYLNNQELGSFKDDSHLTGEGTGVYIRELENDDDLTVRFDDFGIISP
jgi:hypothetical protein